MLTLILHITLCKSSLEIFCSFWGYKDITIAPLHPIAIFYHIGFAVIWCRYLYWVHICGLAKMRLDKKDEFGTDRKTISLYKFYRKTTLNRPGRI